MSFSVYSKDFDFTFQPYTIENPGPEGSGGYIRPNYLDDFINASNYSAATLNFQPYVDSLIQRYGIELQQNYTERKILFTVDLDELLKDDGGNQGEYKYQQWGINISISPRSEYVEPHANIGFYYSYSNTLDSWVDHDDHVSPTVTWNYQQQFLNPHETELILLYMPADSNTTAALRDKNCIGFLWNSLEFSSGGSQQAALGYYGYEDSILIEQVESMGYSNINSENTNYHYLNSYGTRFGMIQVSDLENFISALNLAEPGSGTITPDDPDEDTSEPGGGDGDYTQGGGDEVNHPTLPTNDGTGTGFFEIYVPTPNQLKALSTYMLSNDFISAVKKLYADPMDYIISLKMIPFTPQYSGSVTITVGGVTTNVAMNKAASRWFKKDLGSISVIGRYGSFLDYSPYTKAAIYLPFIGIKEIDVDEIMGTKSKPGSVSVSYNIDIVTGDCVASVKCHNKNGLNGVTYTFDGNCACSLPLSGRDMSAILSSSVSGVSSGILAGVSASTGNMMGVVYGAVSGINSIMSSKPIPTRSGGFSGSSGFLGEYKPYLIIESPRQSLSSKFIEQNGLPSNIGGAIKDFNKYTEFSSVRLHDIETLNESFMATDDELEEINQVLSDGVYL